MFAVPSFFGYNTTFVNGPVATAATGVGETSFTANWNAFTGATYYLLDVSTSPSFSSFVLQDEFTTSTSYVVIGLTASTTYYYRVRANVGVDPDAQAFFDRVTTAGGTLSATEQTATNQLVLDMKAAGIWSAMKAVYPMVGASAAACAQNLKSSSFTGTFTSGWTFASTGVTPNGTSAYLNTNCSPNNMAQNSASGFIYNRTDNVQITLNGTTNFEINDFDPGRALYTCVNNTEQSIGTQTTTAGFWGVSRISSTGYATYKNNSNIANKTVTSTTPVSTPIFIASRNVSGSPVTFGNKEVAFTSIGDGLTDTQASNLYTAVQAFQTTLSRQV